MKGKCYDWFLENPIRKLEKENASLKADNYIMKCIIEGMEREIKELEIVKTADGKELE